VARPEQTLYFYFVLQELIEEGEEMRREWREEQWCYEFYQGGKEAA